MEDFKPDLVHIDEEHYSAVTFQAAKIAARHGMPFVFQTWQNIFKNYPLPFSAIERYVFSHSQAALAGTEEIQGVLRMKGFKKPIHIIPLGVDTDLFFPDHRREYRHQFGIQDRWAIGYIGRLVEEKGIYDLAAALIPILATHRDWVWVVAGSGDGESKLRGLVGPVQSQVLFIPWLGTEDMARLMNSLNTLVVPSRTTPHWKEQFGRVLIEAMAVEVPVIAYDSGAIPQVVGDAGIVVREGDVSALGNHILHLAESPADTDRLREKGRERAFNHFSQKHVAEKIMAVYRTLL